MKKRGHNEGSIHQRKDGRWVAVVDLGYVNGKRKRKYIYGSRRQDVAEKMKGTDIATKVRPMNPAVEAKDPPVPVRRGAVR